MGYVTTLFARKMVAAAGLGAEGNTLLERAGVDPGGPWDPKAMMPADTYYEMLERIADRVDATDLPVRTGASMRLDEYGALGLAFKAATTLGASYARVERYARLWTSVVDYELRPVSEGTLFVLRRAGERRLGMRLSNEATLVSAVAIARQACPEPLAPIRVHVGHAGVLEHLGRPLVLHGMTCFLHGPIGKSVGVFRTTVRLSVKASDEPAQMLPKTRRVFSERLRGGLSNPVTQRR